MKPLLLFIALICTQWLYAQHTDDSTKYTRYTNMYGVQFPKLWASRVLRTPFNDTAALSALPGAIQAGLDGSPYWWNGIKWNKLGSGEDFNAYVKYADSLVKYATPYQLANSIKDTTKNITLDRVLRNGAASLLSAQVGQLTVQSSGASSNLYLGGFNIQTDNSTGNPTFKPANGLITMNDNTAITGELSIGGGAL